MHTPPTVPPCNEYPKVGSLWLDLIVDGLSPAVYAYVNMTDQGEHQCVSYDYPRMEGREAQALGLLGKNDGGLRFLTVATLRDEDCGIFMAPLARDRWIHVWVDLDGNRKGTNGVSKFHVCFLCQRDF